MTTKTSTRRALAVAGLTAALVAGLAPTGAVADGAPSTSSSATPKPALPGPGAGLDAWKHAVEQRIDQRLATLKGLKIAVDAATRLTDADKSTLATLVSTDTAGLTALRAKTDAETTVDAVKADGRSMIVDYRIYLLVVPKVRLTIAADAETDTIGRLRGAHDKLAQVATQLGAQGKDVSQETAQLADMSSALDAAQAALDGQVATLLAVQPSADGNAMRAATGPVRNAVHSARADLKAASTDAKQVGKELKQLG
jgi:hypothetical protein